MRFGLDAAVKFPDTLMMLFGMLRLRTIRNGDDACRSRGSRLAPCSLPRTDNERTCKFADGASIPFRPGLNRVTASPTGEPR